MKRVISVFPASLGVTVLAAGLLGCRGSSLNPKSDLELRLDAANQQTNVSERDESLSAIALAAAEERDDNTLAAALGRIHDPDLRDRTAERAAVRLVRVDDRASANRVATSIKNAKVRDETMRRLAANDSAIDEEATTQLSAPTSRPLPGENRPR